jgi:hypothetical protein
METPASVVKQVMLDHQEIESEDHSLTVAIIENDEREKTSTEEAKNF